MGLSRGLKLIGKKLNKGKPASIRGVHARRNYPLCIRRCNKECLLSKIPKRVLENVWFCRRTVTFWQPRGDSASDSLRICGIMGPPAGTRNFLGRPSDPWTEGPEVSGKAFFLGTHLSDEGKKLAMQDEAINQVLWPSGSGSRGFYPI